jgi:hypothetical protein
VTDQENAPPIEDGAPEGPIRSSGRLTTTPASQNTAQGRPPVFDALAGLRRRREHAVRSEGGDPDYPGDRKFHRPTTGLRAAGYRYGFSCGGADALRRVWPFIPAEHRSEVSRIAADYRDGGQ